MKPETRAHLAAAPELIIVALVGHGLVALERALVVEHPTLPDSDLPDTTRTLRRARAVLRATAQLHRALAAYTRAVNDALAPTDASVDDLLF